MRIPSMVPENSKIGSCFQQVRRWWGGDSGMKVSNAKHREFLETALVSGQLLAITIPLLCHTEPALHTSKSLASNKILFLSKLIFGEDLSGVKSFTNQMNAIHLDARSLFPQRIKWQSEKQCEGLEPRNNEHDEVEGYFSMLHTSCLHLYQKYLQPIFFRSIEYILYTLQPHKHSPKYRYRRC